MSCIEQKKYTILLDKQHSRNPEITLRKTRIRFTMYNPATKSSTTTM